GDRFILRRHAEARTLGGGVVLGTSRHRLKAGKAFVIEGLERKRDALADPSGERLAEEAIRAAGERPVAPARVRVETGLGEEGRLRKSGRSVALSDEQEKLRGNLLDLFRKARFQPPSVEEAAQALKLPKKREPDVAKLLKLLVEEKELVQVGPGMYVPRPAM